MSAIDRRTWLREALEAAPLASTELFGMERPECDAWLSDCEGWLSMDCVSEARGVQAIGSLHVAFCEWAITHRSVPCRRDVFEELLDRLGIPCADGFALGLMLASDLKALATGGKG